MSGALRQERERRGLSLREVADRCRIPAHFIEAIESGNADGVPRGPFFEVYRRRYIEFLGLPPGEEPSGRPRSEPTLARPVHADDGEPEGSEIELQRTRTVTRHYDSVPLIRLVLAGFLVTVALILVMKLVAGMLDRTGSANLDEAGVMMVPLGPPEAAVQAEPAPELTAPAPLQPAALLAATAAPKQAAENLPGAPMRVHLRASDRVKVAVALDGQTVYDDWMEMGQTHDFHGASEIAVDAGDLTRLAIHLDGQKVDPLGSLGQRRRLVFLREAE